MEVSRHSGPNAERAAQYACAQTKPQRVELVWPGKSQARQELRGVGPGTNGTLRSELGPPFLEIQEILDTTGRAREVGAFWRPAGSGGAVSGGIPGFPGISGVLAVGDSIESARAFSRDLRGKVDLIYIDPPFLTGSAFSMQVEVGEQGTPVMVHAYDDSWRSGTSPDTEPSHRGLSAYLDWLYRNLVLMRELLSETGSIFVHLDHHAAHYVKVMMDEVFGPGGRDGVEALPGFRNEIIWKYGGGGAPKRHFRRKHDTILWYTKGSRWKFNVQYQPYTEGTLQRGLTKVKGPKYRLNPEGASLDDTWVDIPKILSPTAFENLKYPTQKPEALLMRIIQSATDPGDLVADFFSGSGTTPAVAEKLGRRWIAVDANPYAVHLARKRLLGIAGCRPFAVARVGSGGARKEQEAPAQASSPRVTAEVVRPDPSGPEIVVRLTGFTPARPAIPDKVLAAARSWEDLVDYWAVDPGTCPCDGHAAPPTPPVTVWRQFRSRANRKLSLISGPIEAVGQGCVRVVVADVYGGIHSAVAGYAMDNQFRS